MKAAFYFTIAFIIFSLTALAQVKYDMVVTQDSTSQYHTVQEAVDAVRALPEKQVLIFIKNGIYREKIVIPSWKNNISFIGEDKDKTIITYDDYSGKENINTFNSYTVWVLANNFTAENITFENSAGPVGQAVALHVDGDRCILKNCRIIGNQDTLLVSGENSRQYYLDCYIEGTTDFIFGSATAVFDQCIIHSKKNSYITAASTPENHAYGLVFLNCKLTAPDSIKKVYLGRPWRSFAAVTFVECDMGPHILPEGWHNWSKPEREKTSRYLEFKSKGPGANSATRVKWSQQLSAKEAKRYTAENILKGCDGWNVRKTAGD